MHQPDDLHDEAWPPTPAHTDHQGPGGETPVLVLLHAFPLDSSMFDRVVPLLTPHARVVTVDLPGLGGSGARPDQPSMPHLHQSVIAVLDHLDIKQATFVGVSTGGYVSLEVAALSPERLSGLVLAGSTCWVTDPDLPDERYRLAAELEHAGTLGPLDGAADGGIGETARREQPELLDAVRRVVAANDPAGVAWIARAIASRHDTSGTLRDLERPVLLIFGEEDTETPPERFGWAMNGMRGGEHSDTRIVLLPDTGHLAALEQPQRFADAILDWLPDV